MQAINTNSFLSKMDPDKSTDFTSMSIPELLGVFEQLIEAEDKTEMHKNAETIKSCFYKLLKKDQPTPEPGEEAPEKYRKCRGSRV